MKSTLAKFKQYEIQGTTIVGSGCDEGERRHEGGDYIWGLIHVYYCCGGTIGGSDHYCEQHMF